MTENEQKVETEVQTEAPVETPEVPETPSTETKTAEAGNSFEDISDLLHFDRPPEEGVEEKSAKPKEEPPSDDLPDGDKGEEKTPPASEPGKDAKAPEDKSSTELKDALAAVLGEMKFQAKSEAETAPKKDEEKKGPRYNAKMPDSLYQALDSDDAGVRRQGMDAMVSAVMNQVYEDVMKEVTQSRQTIMTQDLPAYIQQQQSMAAAVKTMQDDFYGRHAAFGQTPQMRKLVSLQAVELAKSMGKDYKGYTPEFGDKLAEHMTALLGAAPAVKEKAKPDAGKKPGEVAQPGTGTRAAVNTDPNSPAAMKELLH